MIKVSTNFLLVIVLVALTISCTAQNASTPSKNYLTLSWKEVATRMPGEWYGSSEAKIVADSVLKYQTAIGGWSKNHDWHKGMDQQEWNRIKTSGIGATFDNGATLTEMMFLAKIYARVTDERYRMAFEKGFNYILEAQYKNGGWPQFYPIRPGNVSYSAHITYNDDAMLHVMQLLKDIKDDAPVFAPLQISGSMKAKAAAAFDKGVDCILNTQIIAKEQHTVWCAQHDEFTFKPAKARAYELPSYSGSESVGLTLLLMDIKNPTKEIIDAVKGAVNWFETYRITGSRLDTETGTDGKKNRIVVKDNSAPPLWARFYDLETGKPFFCDRDGIKKNTLAEIGYERRNGYSWYTNAPEKVLRKYPEWAKQWRVN